MLTTGLLILVLQTLLPGTTSTWTNGTWTWAGNKECASAGFLLSAASPAINQGALIAGFHCAMAGGSIGQANQPNGSPCVEWYESAPDIGSCEFYAMTGIPAPSNLSVK